MAKSEPGWKCPYCGELYCTEETIGYGSPPSCPACQVAHPGEGRFEMQRAAVEVKRDALGHLEGVTFDPKDKGRISLVDGMQPQQPSCIVVKEVVP